MRKVFTILLIIIIIPIIIIIGQKGMFVVHLVYDIIRDDREARRPHTQAPILHGDKIINALNAYHVDHRVYPVKLDELVPKYITRIPDPGWGVNKWNYHREDQIENPFNLWNNKRNFNNFSLDVRVGEDYAQGWFYLSQSRSWTYEKGIVP